MNFNCSFCYQPFDKQPRVLISQCGHIQCCGICSQKIMIQQELKCTQCNAFTRMLTSNQNFNQIPQIPPVQVQQNFNPQMQQSWQNQQFPQFQQPVPQLNYNNNFPQQQIPAQYFPYNQGQQMQQNNPCGVQGFNQQNYIAQPQQTQMNPQIQNYQQQIQFQQPYPQLYQAQQYQMQVQTQNNIPSFVQQQIGSPPLVQQQIGSPPLVQQQIGSPPLVQQQIGSPPIVQQQIGSPPLVQQQIGSPPIVQQQIGSPPLVQQQIGSPPIVQQQIGSPPLVQQQIGPIIVASKDPPSCQQHWNICLFICATCGKYICNQCKQQPHQQHKIYSQQEIQNLMQNGGIGEIQQKQLQVKQRLENYQEQAKNVNGEEIQKLQYTKRQLTDIVIKSLELSKKLPSDQIQQIKQMIEGQIQNQERIIFYEQQIQEQQLKQLQLKNCLLLAKTKQLLQQEKQENKVQFNFEVSFQIKLDIEQIKQSFQKCVSAKDLGNVPQIAQSSNISHLNQNFVQETNSSIGSQITTVGNQNIFPPQRNDFTDNQITEELTGQNMNASNQNVQQIKEILEGIQNINPNAKVELKKICQQFLLYKDVGTVVLQYIS